MMRNPKKIFFILVFSSFCLLFFPGFIFAQELEIDYPQVPGVETPTTVKTLLPEYIRYIFNLSLIIAGLIAFISLVYGGVRYLASAGNPTTLSDARGQIIAGIFGLIILVSSYLLLTQLNPQLITLEIEKKEFEKGVILYAEAGCPGGANPEAAGLVVDEDFLRVRGTQATLGDPALGGFNNQAKAIYFYNSSDELEVKIFSEINYGPEPPGKNPVWNTARDAIPYPFSRGACFNFEEGFQSQSIQLIWKLPGVYLFTDTNCRENPRLFTGDISDFGDFNNKARSIKIISRTRIVCAVGDPDFPGCTDPFTQCSPIVPVCQKTIPIDKFGAALYQDNNFRHDVEVFFGGSRNEWPPECITLNDETGFGNGEGDICTNNVMFHSYCKQAVGEKASAITIFQQWMGNEISPGGVALYQHENLNLDENGLACGPYTSLSIGEPRWISSCSVFPTNQVSSIKIEGNYIAVLFREDGRGQVFRHTVLRLKDQHIGEDEAQYLLVIPVTP